MSIPETRPDAILMARCLSPRKERKQLVAKFTQGPTSRSNQSAAQAFAGALKRHGVDTVFGQSIPSLIHLAAPEFGIRQIAYRTENAGAIMADAYARISHKVGIVTAQNGPAATLLVPALSEALTASVPVVALVQDVALENFDRNAFQELDHLRLFGGCCKWLRRIHSPDRIEDYVDMAFTAATSGRPGPAVLLCPYDLIGASSAASSGRNARLGTYPLDRVVADPANIAAAADLLAGAERPLVIAGGGVHLSDAAAELTLLQESASLAVATTSMGKGAVDERHPLSVGVVGYFMGPGGMARHQRGLIDEADVILLVGNRTNQNGTDSWRLLPRSARFIHLDIDGAEIGRNYEALRLLGDAKLTLAALAAALQARDLTKRRAAKPALERSIAAGRERHRLEAEPLLRSDARPIRPERLMGDLAKVLRPTDIVAADASYASIWIANYLPSLAPGMLFLTPRGMAGLGWGLPMALGAKLAAPDRQVHCLVGDGGFAHVWSELETSRRHSLPVTITVLNNQVLGYQKHAEDVLFGAHTDAVYFQPVDHAAIAAACGLRGCRVENPADYAAALAEAAAARETTVIDVIVDPEAYPPISSFEGKLPLSPTLREQSGA
jgi:acetolactate synthase-1/2/3 large subunit